MIKKNPIKTLATLTGLLVTTGASAVNLNLGYLSNDQRDALRIGVQAEQGAKRINVETNVTGLTQTESSVSSRVIGHYTVKGLHLSAMGTYARNHKATLIGVGYAYRWKNGFIGLDTGLQDDAKPGAFGHWAYKNDHYRLSTSGYIDYTDRLTGRADLMYTIGPMKIGYEHQHNTNTNWIKASIGF